MRFLIDAQLPSKLCDILQLLQLEAKHIDSLPNGDETRDKDISKYADKNDFIVITKDLDFYHSHMFLGQPKKLLLITTGNIKNKTLFTLFRKNVFIIKKLFESCDYVEMSNRSIIGHGSKV